MIDIQPTIKLSPIEMKVFNIITDNFPHSISRDEIFDKIYGLKDDGGPESEPIKVFICRIKKALPRGRQIKTLKKAPCANYLLTNGQLPLTIKEMLTPLELRIYNIIKRWSGVSSRGIAEIVFDCDVNRKKSNQICVHKVRMNKKLKIFKKRIQGVSHRGYRILDLAT